MAKKNWVLYVSKRITKTNEIFFRIDTNAYDSEKYPSINIDWNETACKPKRDIRRDLQMLFNDHKQYATFRMFFVTEDGFLGNNPANGKMPKFLEQTLKVEPDEMAFFRKILIEVVNA